MNGIGMCIGFTVVGTYLIVYIDWALHKDIIEEGKYQASLVKHSSVSKSIHRKSAKFKKSGAQFSTVGHG